MKLVIEHRVYFCDNRLDDMQRVLTRIDQRILTIMTDLTRITTEVTEMGDAVDGAVALLAELAQQIRDNATDPEALNSLADSLDAKGTALADAVVANTPADPDNPPV